MSPRHKYRKEGINTESNKNIKKDMVLFYVLKIATATQRMTPSSTLYYSSFQNMLELESHSVGNECN